MFYISLDITWHPTQTFLSSEQKSLQPSRYTQAINNMIGVFYTIHLVCSRYGIFSIRSHSSSGFDAQSAFKEIIGLFPDYDESMWNWIMMYFLFYTF